MSLALRRAGFGRIPPDSGIWFPGKDVRKVLFAVDSGAPELLFAKQAGYDLLISHHPVGPARLTFPQVVHRHVDFMREEGIPKKAAEDAVKDLLERIDVRAQTSNYLHEVQIARMLKMPYMNIHLPIDQISRDFLLAAIRRSGAKTVGALIDDLSEIREFRKAKTEIALLMGKPRNPVGNWVLLFATGTNGGYAVAKAYYDRGLDTIVQLHIDYEELVRLRRECRGNLVILGHMAGDSIGINIFLNDLRKHGIETDTIGVVR